MVKERLQEIFEAHGARAKANTTYVIKQIESVAGSRAATFCHSTFEQASSFNQLKMIALVASLVSSEDDKFDQITKATEGISSRFNLLQSTTARIVLREIVEDAEKATQAFNMLVSLVNRDNEMFREILMTGIETAMKDKGG